MTIPGPNCQERRKRGVYLAPTVRRGEREDYTWPQLSGEEEERIIPGPNCQERRKRGLYLAPTVRRGGREDYSYSLNCQERRERGK